MILLYPILSAILSTCIEWLRIRLSYGKVSNVNKLWTYTIGVILFAASLSLSVDYYDDISPLYVLCYAMHFASVRGVIYDPLLNLLRGLPIDYKSETTNSIIDIMIGNKLSFILYRSIYLSIAIITYLLL
jgi:hypothetical protein